MEADQALDTFDFDDHPILDDEIRAMLPNDLALVQNGHYDLTDVRQASCGQLDTKRSFVTLFHQPRTEFTMHCDAAADDLMRQRVVFVHGKASMPQCLSVSWTRVAGEVMTASEGR
jgi:hypothetical protein